MNNHIVRKHHRVELDYMARVLTVAAEPVCDCALIDVSQGGARIAVLAADMIPDEFLLRFSATSDVSRRCKVAWRKEDEIGVVFVKAVDTAKVRQDARRARLLETPCP
jgi:PilZ domain